MTPNKRLHVGLKVTFSIRILDTDIHGKYPQRFVNNPSSGDCSLCPGRGVVGHTIDRQVRELKFSGIH